jgi:dimethylhistidine N-methyltransferase
MKRSEGIEFIDHSVRGNTLLKEVLVGLSKSQKTINPKFLYDEKGSQIFKQICHLADYYPTQAEKEIMKNFAHEMASLLGEGAIIIEPGSGSEQKVRYLLDELKSPLGYVPIEISKEVLLETVDDLGEAYPELRLFPVCADFTQELELPISLDALRGRKVIYFPGSTIGNFEPKDAITLLKSWSKMIGVGGGLLIGVDLKKDKNKLIRAYDDSEGVTAEFNLNLLDRLNREADATFDKENFSHVARYEEELGRVEMHLESKIPQLVRVSQSVFRFRQGETIHTECSYKYSVDEFCELAAKARFKIINIWKDSESMFAVYYFEKE